MAIANFTPSAYTQVTALGFPQVIALPAGGAATALITALGPGIVVVLPQTAAATTTATQATVGASTLTLASAASVAIGQLVLAAGVPAGTIVIGIAGSVITISNPTTAALSAIAINFFAPVAINGGVAVTISTPLALGVGANTHLGFISQDGMAKGQINIAMGT